MNAGRSVQPSPSITSTPGGRVERVSEGRDLAVAHEHVDPRVQALAGIQHARAAHEHIGARRRCLGQAPRLASAHVAASAAAEEVVEHGHAHDQAGATWRVTSDAAESATSSVISTPRFIGPGCMTTCPGRRRSDVMP